MPGPQVRHAAGTPSRLYTGSSLTQFFLATDTSAFSYPGCGGSCVSFNLPSSPPGPGPWNASTLQRISPSDNSASVLNCHSSKHRESLECPQRSQYSPSLQRDPSERPAKYPWTTHLQEARKSPGEYPLSAQPQRSLRRLTYSQGLLSHNNSTAPASGSCGVGMVRKTHI